MRLTEHSASNILTALSEAHHELTKGDFEKGVYYLNQAGKSLAAARAGAKAGSKRKA